MAVDMGIAGIFFAESGGIHPLVWILAIMIAAFSIVIVWIITVSYTHLTLPTN